MEPLEEKVKQALERAGYDRGEALLVVAVSGGPDSTALLHSLLNLTQVSGLKLHVAHLDHDFRGEEAEEDARFVSALAGRLGLPSTVEKADAVAYQKEMGLSSFEEAAREVRYGFLARTVANRSADAVALGHTSDDLAETVLMHLIRGSGIHGLRGMVELSTWMGRRAGPAAVLFRPFLGVTREETVAYCRNRGIAFREDSANLSPRFTRNRVRHELLPSLARYNPKIKEALVRLSQAAALEADYLEVELSEVWPSVARREGDWISLDVGHLMSLHPLMRRIVLRKAYQELVGDTRRLEEAHLKDMEGLIDSPSGKVLSLPRGLRLHAVYGRLILGRGVGVPSPFPTLEGEHELLLPSSVEEKVTRVPGWVIRASRLSHHPDLPPQEGEELDCFTACLDAEAVGDVLRVRARLPGDRFQPLGMQEEKKLQDFFVDEKVPRSWRDGIPLVVSGRGMAWVVGYRVAEWARIERIQGISRPLLWVKFELKK